MSAEIKNVEQPLKPIDSVELTQPEGLTDELPSEEESDGEEDSPYGYQAELLEQLTIFRHSLAELERGILGGLEQDDFYVDFLDKYNEQNFGAKEWFCLGEKDPILEFLVYERGFDAAYRKIQENKKTLSKEENAAQGLELDKDTPPEQEDGLDLLKLFSPTKDFVLTKSLSANGIFLDFSLQGREDVPEDQVSDKEKKLRNPNYFYLSNEANYIYENELKDIQYSLFEDVTSLKKEVEGYMASHQYEIEDNLLLDKQYSKLIDKLYFYLVMAIDLGRLAVYLDYDCIMLNGFEIGGEPTEDLDAESIVVLNTYMLIEVKKKKK